MNISLYPPGLEKEAIHELYMEGFMARPLFQYIVDTHQGRLSPRQQRPGVTVPPYYSSVVSTESFSTSAGSECPRVIWLPASQRRLLALVVAQYGYRTAHFHGVPALLPSLSHTKGPADGRADASDPGPPYRFAILQGGPCHVCVPEPCNVDWGSRCEDP